MDTTPNLGLRQPARTDKFKISDFNTNADIIDNALKNRILILTRNEYDNLANKSADIVYFITEEDGTIKLYLGGAEVEVGGGGSGVSAATAALVSLYKANGELATSDVTREDI